MANPSLHEWGPESGPKSARPGQVWILVAFLLVCLAAGLLGSLATAPQIPTWYATLAKPSWNPPNWIFAPVWTTLYVLMGIAAWLVWRKRGFRGRTAVLFWSQLVLNALWSILFFGLENPGGAFVEVVLLWVLILATVRDFARVSKAGAALLAPYLAWVTFASALNLAIWRLNG